MILPFPYSEGGRTNPSSDTMMIVAFGKSFSVSDATPKKLIMNTLARAAIERDKAMEDGEEMQLLPGKDQDADGSRLNTIQRNNRNAGSSTNTLNGGGKQRVTFEDLDGGPSSSTLVANSPRYDKNCEITKLFFFLQPILMRCIRIIITNVTTIIILFQT